MSKKHKHEATLLVFYNNSRLNQCCSQNCLDVVCATYLL